MYQPHSVKTNGQWCNVLATTVDVAPCLPPLCRRAKYQLHCLVRTNMVADDDAYGAAQEMEDSEGLKGIKLSRELPRIAGGIGIVV